MKKNVGKELGISNWIEISQDKIKQFAEITQDEQWIHLDKEKSKLHSPYKTTVAHGFMILSLATDSHTIRLMSKVSKWVSIMGLIELDL